MSSSTAAPCECGCRGTPKTGARFLRGHHLRSHVLTEATRAKRSEAMKRQWREGLRRGSPRSEETRAKIAAAHRRKREQDFHSDIALYLREVAWSEHERLEHDVAMRRTAAAVGKRRRREPDHPPRDPAEPLSDIEERGLSRLADTVVALITAEEMAPHDGLALILSFMSTRRDILDRLGKRRDRRLARQAA